MTRAGAENGAFGVISCADGSQSTGAGAKSTCWLSPRHQNIPKSLSELVQIIDFSLKSNEQKRAARTYDNVM